MNLKLKRLVRTVSSEQYALFDLDQLNEEDDQPMTIGKLDLHYTNEGVYGTLLLWDSASRQLRPAVRREFIHALLREITQPMGVPNEYVVEFFAPTLQEYEVFHNVALGDEEVEAEVGHPADEDGRASGDAVGSRRATAPS
ncbi:MAG: hypothetical protein KatS3mg050_1578 [Litorilinea sp.]|nr:MAG: hypothetical protein KatS3mg050_1578 [Litorilinea sp.]